MSEHSESMVSRQALQRLLGGIVIGCAFLMPGISGGTMAATLGYFEPAIAAMSNIFKTPKKSIAYLLPLGIGLILGALLVAVVLVRVLAVAETQAICFFLGIVGGGLPSMWRDAHPGRLQAKHWALTACGLAVTSLLFLLESRTGGITRSSELTLATAVGTGAIFGMGSVLPGISGSFFVVYLGWYVPMLQAITSLNIPIIMAAAAGFLVVLLLLVKVVHWLFRQHRRDTYSVIIGFVIGSLALVFPRDFFGPLWWANILLLAIGCVCGVVLGRIKKSDDAIFAD